MVGPQSMTEVVREAAMQRIWIWMQRYRLLMRELQCMTENGREHLSLNRCWSNSLTTLEKVQIAVLLRRQDGLRTRIHHVTSNRCENKKRREKDSASLPVRRRDPNCC